MGARAPAEVFPDDGNSPTPKRFDHFATFLRNVLDPIARLSSAPPPFCRHQCAPKALTGHERTQGVLRPHAKNCMACVLCSLHFLSAATYSVQCSCVDCLGEASNPVSNRARGGGCTLPRNYNVTCCSSKYPELVAQIFSFCT